MNDREEMFILRDNTLVKLSRERLFFDRMCEMTERKKNWVYTVWKTVCPYMEKDEQTKRDSFTLNRMIDDKQKQVRIFSNILRSEKEINSLAIK